MVPAKLHTNDRLALWVVGAITGPLLLLATWGNCTRLAAARPKPPERGVTEAPIAVNAPRNVKSHSSFGPRQVLSAAVSPSATSHGSMVLSPSLPNDIVPIRQGAFRRVLDHFGKTQSARVTGLSELQGSDYVGQFVAIEYEDSLSHFHAALQRLVTGQDEDGKVRILAYGASHTQADIYPGYLRAYLQERFGNGGQGFVLLGRVNAWYRTLDTNVRHHNLRVRHARSEVALKNEPLGLFGAALASSSGVGYGEITTASNSANTRFELQYYAQPNGCDVIIQVDGKQIAVVKTSSEKPGPAYRGFTVAGGRHIIRVLRRGRGPLRLFGIVAETDQPGVVIDTLGISGAQMESQLRWKEDDWIEAVRHRNPDLVTFAYGTNEVMDPGLELTKYEEKLGLVLQRLRRASPGVSCLLISPFDVSKRVEGSWVTLPRLHKIIDAQRRVAKRYDCGFWNGYRFTGGAGSMHRWMSADRPLASTDHIHLTNLGYAYAGVALGDALMRAYDRDRDRPVDSVGAATDAVGAQVPASGSLGSL